MINSDSPITDSNKDAFQRLPFAKRITELIKKNTSKESVTIGIYGKWGEGKTSVLNLIDHKLKNKKNIVTIKFNPWIFSEEEKMLMSFFQILSNKIDIPLKTKKIKFGEALTEYSGIIGSAISMTGLSGGKDAFEDLGKKLSQKSIEDYRDIIDKILVESKIKVVVFIDDIDRLNKKEIHTILRLVKLTAYFKNTVYILAFDDELVAKALDEQYSNGGQDFLEKIIQLPLRMPKASTTDLKNYTLNHLLLVLEENKIVLNEDENYRFSTFLGETFYQILIILAFQ